MVIQTKIDDIVTTNTSMDTSPIHDSCSAIDNAITDRIWRNTQPNYHTRPEVRQLTTGWPRDNSSHRVPTAKPWHECYIHLVTTQDTDKYHDTPNLDGKYRGCGVQ